MKPISKGRELSQFLLVMGASLAVALLTVYFLITHYGPTGSYKMGSIILSPEVIGNLSYQEVDPNGGKKRYVLDKVELVFAEPEARRWSRIELSHEEYARFYELLAAEQSIPVTEELANNFLQSEVMSLSVLVRPDRSLSGAWQQRSFQEIQFAAQGDSFRVELRVDDPSGSWAYFQRPGVYNEVRQLLTSRR